MTELISWGELFHLTRKDMSPLIFSVTIRLLFWNPP